MYRNFLRQFGFVLAGVLAVSAQAGPHKLRVPDRAVAESLLAHGGRLLADYPSFQLIEVDEVPVTKSFAASHFQVVDQFDAIQLNARSLDTRVRADVPMQKSAATFAGRRLQMIQFVGPVKPEWRQALAQTGVRIVHYLPQNAYLVYGDAAVLATMQTWAATEPVVQWTGDYLGEYKIHPLARAPAEKTLTPRVATGLFAIQLVADAGNSATLQLIEQLRLAPVVRSSQVLGYRNIVVALPPDQLDVLAAQPDVVSILPYSMPKKRDERQDQIVAGNLTGSSPTGPGYLDWLAGKGFTQAQFDASGLVVDVTDSGIDNGTTSPGHFALYPLANTTRPSRVVYSRFERTVFNPGASLQGCDGHGNLNAHILAGYSAQTGGFPFNDSSGYNYDVGVCPFVKVGCSVVFDNSGGSDFTSPDFATLLTHAYNSGARISNNSWGGAGTGAYDSDAQTYDALVRDVGDANQNRPMVVVFAAGNEGLSGVHTIDSPGTAKNVITVGAAENVRSLSTLNGGNSSSGLDGCDTSDTAANSANDIIDFSSRGPCVDGRSKPDLVAPGSHITGGAPQSGAPTTNGLGSSISCFNGSGVCGIQNSEFFFPTGQKFFTVSSGTSHATPAVSGACALVRQYFINLGLEPAGAPPSPAMTKAFLINSARYLNGSHANDTLPSPTQGMGEVNLGTAFDGAARVLRDQVAEDTITNSGQTRVFSGFVSDSTKPFRVTVAWTDAPGSTTAGPALVNDLDLQVTLGGVTYLGNVFSGAASASGGTADSLNNVENVFLPAGVSGPFTVTINGANIAANALGTSSVLPAQDFALVIYNATLTPEPAISVNGFAVMAESCPPANDAVDPGETVTVNFNFQNLGTANTANLKVTLLEANGVVNPSGAQTLGVLVTNGATAAAAFTFTATGSCGDTITPTFIVQDGGKDLGSVSAKIPLGTPAAIYVQNFDGTAAPTLPAWWTTRKSSGQSLWTVSKKNSDTAPNAAFSPEPGTAGVNALISPAIPLPPGGAQLAFRNNYNLESGFDGGVLEIKIGTNDFVDVLDAGGSFVSGGYGKSLRTFTGNPLAGRKAWSGNSGGYLTTTVNLPPAAAGQTIQLQWRCGTDTGNGGPGWFIDAVQVSAYWCCPGGPPLPPFIPAAGSYNGLFFDTNGVQVPSSGALAATLTARGKYTGTLQLGTSRYSISGTFDPFGAATNNIPRSGATPLKLLLQVDTADNARIVGTVSGGTWLASLDAERSAWNTTANPAPFAGKYTLLFPGAGNSADATQPQGDGFGTLTVSTLGKVTFSGTLADNTPFSQTTTASQLSQWPLYVSLYSRKGQILGWLNFSNSVPNLSGVYDWIKLTNPAAKFYPSGFVIQTNAIGSKYQAPLAGMPLLNFTNGTATFLGGNFFDSFSSPATNTPGGKLTYRGTNKLSLMLNSPTFGLFKGSLVDPVGKKTIAFKGAILQTQQVASGFFTGTNQSGKVIFAP